MTEINKWIPTCPDCISETSELAISLPESDKELEGPSMREEWQKWKAAVKAWHVTTVINASWQNGGFFYKELMNSQQRPDLCQAWRRVSYSQG